MDPNGDPLEAVGLHFGVTENDFVAFYESFVFILDGYHRFGAVNLFLTNPRALLAPELDIDWESMALLYPDWIKLDRLKKVTFADQPDEK